MFNSWFFDLFASAAFIALAAFVWLRPLTQPEASAEGDVSVPKHEGVPNPLTAPLVEKIDSQSGSHPPPSNPLPVPSRITIPPRTRREGTRPLPLPPGLPSAPESSLDSLSNSGAFDDIMLLGKSSSRASHKVRHRATGAFYVRKSMTPRDLPIHDIVRELKRMKEVRHSNIVRCFSVSAISDVACEEVKVLMEFCEGGSLESARKAINDRGAVVEEKIVGRIAEGVSFDPCDLWLV